MYYVYSQYCFLTVVLSEIGVLALSMDLWALYLRLISLLVCRLSQGRLFLGLDNIVGCVLQCIDQGQT